MYSKLFIIVLYILGKKIYFIEKNIYSLPYIPIISVCQKRKPQIDGSFLNLLHI